MDEARLLTSLQQHNERLEAKLDKLQTSSEETRAAVTRLEAEWQADALARTLYHAFTQEFGTPRKLGATLSDVSSRLRKLEDVHTASRARMALLGGLAGAGAAGLVALVQWVLTHGGAG